MSSVLPDLWGAALADARIETLRARLFVIAGAPTTSEEAIWLEPGTDAAHEDRFPLDPGQVREANSERIRGLHRIVVFGGAVEEVLAAKLRHELEHAHQFDLGGKDWYEWDGLVRIATGNAFGRHPGSGSIYNLFPSEADANAAAAQFALRRYGEERTKAFRSDSRTRAPCSRIHVPPSRLTS